MAPNQGFLVQVGVGEHLNIYAGQRVTRPEVYKRQNTKRESLGSYLLRQSRTDISCLAKRLIEHLIKESVEDSAIRCLSIKYKFVGEYQLTARPCVLIL